MTFEPADTFEHAGLTVRICYEEHIDENDNPRTNWDGNLGVMFCAHSNYNLGDEDAPDPRGQMTKCEKCGGEGYVPHDGDPGHYRYEDDTMVCEACAGDGEAEVGIVEYLKREHGARVILPLFLYDHSGITISAGGRLDTGEDDFRRTGRFVPDGAGWDTSSVGVIFDTAESRERCGWESRSDEEIETSLRGEVEYYDLYLTGQVYGYEVLGPDGDVLESGRGFLEPNIHSEKSDLRMEARNAAEGAAEAIEKEHDERTYWQCRDVETIEEAMTCSR